MNKTVLLLTPNPFSITGSGATRIYKRIIEKNPEIKFFFFVNRSEFLESVFLDNCFPIQVEGEYTIAGALEKVYGYRFDIIDIPDYQILSPNPAKVLEGYRIKYSKLVLALHGRPTLTEFKSRKTEFYDFLKTYFYEIRMILSADYVYGISSDYCQKIKTKKRTLIISLDDLLPVLRPGKNFLENRNIENQEKTVVTFIGRQEKVKGIYLYLKLIKLLDPSKYDFEIIGPVNPKLNDFRTLESLKIFSGRNIREQVLSEEEVTNLYRQRNRVFVVLSKFESFSLVALDAIYFQARLIITKEAGIVKSIQTRDIPNLYTFDYKKNEYDTINDIRKILDQIENFSEDFHIKINPRYLPKNVLNKRQILTEISNIYEF